MLKPKLLLTSYLFPLSLFQQFHTGAVGRTVLPLKEGFVYTVTDSELGTEKVFDNCWVKESDARVERVFPCSTLLTPHRPQSVHPFRFILLAGTVCFWFQSSGEPALSLF